MRVNIKLLRYSRLIHVYLSVFLLVVLTFFAITGITLNHPEWNGRPSVTKQTYFVNSDSNDARVSANELLEYAERVVGLDVSASKIEHEEHLMFVDSQEPGGSIYLEADSITGEVLVTTTRYGLLAMLNDLHKGRHTQSLWKAIIDLSGFLVLLFSVTGLIILLPQKKRLKKVVTLGVVVSIVCAWIAIL